MFTLTLLLLAVTILATAVLLADTVGRQTRRERAQLAARREAIATARSAATAGIV